MSNDIAKLKADYLEYYKDVPIQRYAAMAIGRDQDTIIRWRNEDHVFADAVSKSKAEFIRKKVIATKAEFALERLEKEVFGQKSFLNIEKRLDITARPELDAAFTKFLKKYTIQS